MLHRMSPFLTHMRHLQSVVTAGSTALSSSVDFVGLIAANDAAVSVSRHGRSWSKSLN
jgi:ABC-type Fe3+-siderophore transport system permease subunit